MRVTLIKSDARSREKPCLRCGYSLRRLTDSRHCPECGLSVWLSLNQNDSLELSNPDWIKRMTAGLAILMLAQALGLAAYVMVQMQWIPHVAHRLEQQRIMESARSEDDYEKVAAALRKLRAPRARPDLLRLAVVLGGAYLVIYHIGLFFLTQHEGRYPDRLATLRIVSWILCGLAGLVSLLMFTSSVTRGRLMFIEFLVKVCVIASSVTTLAHLRQIARRVPHGTLARICGIASLVPLISLMKVFPCVGAAIVFYAAWLIDFLALLYFPFSIFLFAWFIRIFRKTALAAEKNWEAESAKSPGVLDQ